HENLLLEWRPVERHSQLTGETSMIRKSIALLLSLVCSVSFAATTVPVQLLNTSGSSSGQTIVSAGPSSAAGWSTVPLTGLSSIAANTLLGNATGSTANVATVAVTGCNGAAQALQWTN